VILDFYYVLHRIYLISLCLIELGTIEQTILPFILIDLYFL